MKRSRTLYILLAFENSASVREMLFAHVFVTKIRAQRFAQTHEDERAAVLREWTSTYYNDPRFATGWSGYTLSWQDVNTGVSVASTSMFTRQYMIVADQLGARKAAVAQLEEQRPRKAQVGRSTRPRRAQTRRRDSI